MAASRFLAAAAASVVLFCCVLHLSRESHCNGCMKVANSALGAHFFILALMIFLLKFLSESASKSSFFHFGVEIRFWSCKSLQFVEPLCVILLCFATQSADRNGMAASRFLSAAAASVILFCFASESRKSQCSGCMKVANGAFGSGFFSFWH